MTPDRTAQKRRVAIHALRTQTSPRSQPPGPPVSDPILREASTQAPTSRGLPGSLPRPTSVDSSLFGNMSPNQQLWKETRARPLHKLDGLFTQAGARLGGVAATLTCAIADLESQLADTRDATVRARLLQELDDQRRDQLALGQLKSSAYLIGLRLKDPDSPGAGQALEALGRWTIGQLLDCLREPDLNLDLLVLGLREGITPRHLVELHRAGLTVGAVHALRARCQQLAPDYPLPTLDEIVQFNRQDAPAPALFTWALRHQLPLSDLQAMVKAGLSSERIGWLPSPDATSRAVQRMTPVRDGRSTRVPGAEPLCLRDDAGELHHFLFVPCTPNSPVADQIRKGLCLRQLAKHLGLDVTPDIHPHVLRDGSAGIYGMLITCHDSRHVSTGATLDIDPRQPEILQQYLALEWMAYLCELDVRPEQLTWLHGPKGPQLRPTQPLGGLPQDDPSSPGKLRFVGLGMPELITDELARGLEELSSSTLMDIAGPYLDKSELRWLCRQAERIQVALKGSSSNVQRLQQAGDWTSPAVLQVLGLDATTDRLQRLQSGTDTAGELQREARGQSLAAWHELSIRMHPEALQQRTTSEPATPRRPPSTGSREWAPQHPIRTTRHERSWLQRMQALARRLDSPDVPRLEQLAARHDAALAAWPSARRAELPALVAGWTDVQQSRQALIAALEQVSTQGLPERPARSVARWLQQLQPASGTQAPGAFWPAREHHKALAALQPDDFGSAEEHWQLVTTVAKSCETLVTQPLQGTPPEWLDLAGMQTLDAWTRKLSSELAKLEAGLQTQGMRVPEAIIRLRQQTAQDLGRMEAAQALARHLNRLLPATQPEPLAMQDLLQLVALQPDLNARDIAPVLASGCRVTDIVQAHIRQLPLTLLQLAGTLVEPSALATLPLADLATELQGSIEHDTALPASLRASSPRSPEHQASPKPPATRHRLDDQIDWNLDTLVDDEALQATAHAARRHEELMGQLARTDAATATAWNDALAQTRESLAALGERLQHLARARPNRPGVLLMIGRLQEQVREEQTGLQRFSGFMDRLRHRLAPASLATLRLEDLLPLVQQPDLQPDYLVQGLLAGWKPHEVLLAHQQRLPGWALPLSTCLGRRLRADPSRPG